MEEKKVNLSEYDEQSIPSGEKMKIGIVVAEWNAQITNALAEGAYNTLLQNGVQEKNITIVQVPGSFELTTGASILFDNDDYDAVICLGCVIQGETRHFDFICDAVSNGLTNLSIKVGKPVIFGVLTTNNMEQAIDRSGGQHGNKGIEAAVTAMKMINLYKPCVIKAKSKQWKENHQ